MSSDLRICFLGDSFVNGTGDPTHLGWTGRLCISLAHQGYGITNYTLGIRGETSRDLAQRWQEEVQRRAAPHYDMRLIFSFGTNDTTLEEDQLRVEPAESLQNAHQILSSAQQHYPVLMISPPPIADREQRERIGALTQQLGVLCQDLQIPFLDVFTSLLNSPIWMQEVTQGDGSHPQAAGYEVWAQQIQSWPGWQDEFPLNN